MDFRYSLAGLIVGAFIGFSGVGGGSLMTPILILLFKINPLMAVGTDLLYSVPTKILGASVHQRQKTIDWQLVKWLSFGSIPAALVALGVLAALRTKLDAHVLDTFIRHSVGIMVLAAAAIIVFVPILRKNAAPEAAPQGTINARLVAIGAATGFVVTITSIGSGAFTLPLLLIFIPVVRTLTMVGSDIAFGAILIPVAAAGHWSMHNVDLGVCASLLLGSLPGVYLGSKLSGMVPERVLRPSLAAILVLAASRLV